MFAVFKRARSTEPEATVEAVAAAVPAAMPSPWATTKTSQQPTQTASAGSGHIAPTWPFSNRAA